MVNPVIQVQNISKSYGDTHAVNGISFEVYEGEIFGLLGPNGAGKTTTMECVEGIRKPDNGSILVLGSDPSRDSSALNNRIGVQLQEAQLQKRIKVREAVNLWAALYNNPVDPANLLEQLGLTDKSDTWFMNLSGGQKQRLFIALSLINNPEVVFWDELTTGLDPQARRKIWELVLDVKARGKTVFLTTHLMEEAERLCDRVAIIEHGAIIALDTPTRLVQIHCPERRVVFETANPVNPESFEMIPNLTHLEQSDSQTRLHGHSDAFFAHVIRAIGERDINVTSFRTEIPTLEDVFLKLTGHGIRD